MSPTIPAGRVAASMTPRAPELPDALPLSAEQRAGIERALRRLHEAMRGFWLAWPIAERNPTTVARALGVDRTLCQRVSAVSQAGFVPASMLEGMPGPRALRVLVEAARQTSCPVPDEKLAALAAAVDRLDEAIQETAGSLSKLKRRFAQTHAEAPPALHDAPAQETLFLGASAVTGRFSEATASVGLYDRRGVGDGELRHVRASGNHGIVAEPHAVPMVLEAFEGEAGLDDDGWQRTPLLLPGLTSAACRPVQLNRSPGFAGNAIEIERRAEPSSVYIYTAFPVPDPATLEEPVEESWFMLYSPTRALIFDLYLHESIARRCLLSLDVHLWQTSFALHPHGRWHTRMPQAPAIVQLGRGLARAGTPLHPKHAELTAEVFRRADADPAEYVGFRCEERFPVWRAGYRFELDFAGG